MTDSARPSAQVSLDLLESLVDDGECWFDHHGGCQAHGYLSLEQGELCPQAELKQIIAAANSHHAMAVTGGWVCEQDGEDWPCATKQAEPTEHSDQPGEASS